MSAGIKNIVIIENHIVSSNTVRKNLTLWLMQQGYKVTILSTGTETELALARSFGFSVIDVKSSNRHPRDIYRYIANITNAMKSLDAEVCLTFTIRPAIWGNLVTRWLNIPTITNITGIGPLFESKNLAYKAARLLYRFALKKTSTVFFQNADDLRLFLENKFVKPAQAVQIPGSGVDPQYFSPRPGRNDDGSFVFLFISRLIKDKGILEFIEAARKLKHEFPHVKFQVLGPYWSQNLRENMITSAEIDSWEKEGIIDYMQSTNDTRPFIANADCIVLPSYREGLSNVLLEAGSMQKPCITTDTTGCRDVVVHNVTGLLCPAKDAAALASAMKMLLNLTVDQRHQMGKNARERIIQIFTKQKVIDAYQLAIEKISKKAV